MLWALPTLVLPHHAHGQLQYHLKLQLTLTELVTCEAMLHYVTVFFLNNSVHGFLNVYLGFVLLKILEPKACAHF